MAGVVVSLTTAVKSIKSKHTALVSDPQSKPAPPPEGGRGLAHLLGVPDEVIGLSAVAVGTSLPELVTAVTACRKGHTELVIGNIVGSNLFNLTLVLGTTALVAPVPIPVSDQMAFADFPAMTVFAILAFPMLSRRGLIGKPQGAILLTLYAVYITWAVLSGRVGV